VVVYITRCVSLKILLKFCVYIFRCHPEIAWWITNIDVLWHFVLFSGSDSWGYYAITFLSTWVLSSTVPDLLQFLMLHLLEAPIDVYRMSFRPLDPLWTRVQMHSQHDVAIRHFSCDCLAASEWTVHWPVAVRSIGHSVHRISKHNACDHKKNMDYART
jgi:hypothetical protein